MDDFLLFLRNNWVFIVEIVLLVISILIAIFKKKAVITIDSSYVSDLLLDVPGFIEEAEKILGSGNGSSKLLYVLKRVVSIICEDYRCSVKEIPESLISQIIGFVEDVLSTPQKKEVHSDVQR